MRKMWSVFGLHVALIGLLAVAPACHHSSLAHPGGDGGLVGDGGIGDGGLANALLVSPANPTVTVTSGQPLPTVQFTATYDGQTVVATWSIDRGQEGSIDTLGKFEASGTSAGVAHVVATYSGVRASTQLTVKMQTLQNGDPAALGTIVFGTGGYGGVGGDGPGRATTTAETQALAGTPTVDANVKWLYPYDKTVWPRGLLAPLLQWDSGSHTFTAVSLHLAETNYQYTGTFATPSGPPAPASFRNLPIPEAVWSALTYSNQGEPVTVTLLLWDGTQLVGPLTETWHIAQGTLKGTVYYNSYGTTLVTNSGEHDKNGNDFGAGTLAIRPGLTDPALVAGSDSADKTGCRVCHTVSGNGQLLLSQNGSAYTTTSSFDLLAMNPNGSELPTGSGLTFPAIYPDGSFLVSSSGGMQWGDSTSRVYSLRDGTLVADASLPADLQATLPVFSPDGKHLAFTYWGGAGSDQKSLATLDFTLAGKLFSNLQLVYTPTGATPVSYPSYLPTSNGVVFEVELNETGGGYGFTRDGNTGELWWVDTASKTAARLDHLNGLGYLPSSATHPNDANQEAQLDYEPTVNPVISGGYAWVVFTSRRMYGNVSTVGPTVSDPRDYDWTTEITPKKLWVAAIDLNAAPGTDPSHPAFYLPAQEIHAGNARGYWTVDPCLQDGKGCMSGDECCNGYCVDSGGGAGPVCASQALTCSAEFDKCSTDADCCPGTGLTCVNNRCAQLTPPIK